MDKRTKEAEENKSRDEQSGDQADKKTSTAPFSIQMETTQPIQTDCDRSRNGNDRPRTDRIKGEVWTTQEWQKEGLLIAKRHGYLGTYEDKYGILRSAKTGKAVDEPPIPTSPHCRCHRCAFEREAVNQYKLRIARSMKTSTSTFVPVPNFNYPCICKHCHCRTAPPQPPSNHSLYSTHKPSNFKMGTDKNSVHKEKKTERSGILPSSTNLQNLDRGSREKGARRSEQRKVFVRRRRRSPRNDKSSSPEDTGNAKGRQAKNTQLPRGFYWSSTGEKLSVMTGRPVEEPEILPDSSGFEPEIPADRHSTQRDFLVRPRKNLLSLALEAADISTEDTNESDTTETSALSQEEISSSEKEDVEKKTPITTKTKKM